MEKLVANETFTLTNYNETILNNNFDLKIKCNNNSIDFLYFELPLEIYKQQKTYIVGLLHILCHILTLQKNNGICIIKIDDLIYQPIIEILFLLTNMFDKICIIKPIVTNNISNEKFLLCKHFSFDIRQEKLLKNIKSIINESNNSYEIASLLNIKLPYYFINKLEESNITIGNQQIEYCDLLINIIKHKNKDYKLEMLKKSNIQKCIDWCEKYKIPHNKFIDKLNIFLSSSI